MKIKRSQDDFRVEEILSPEIARAVSPPGERHALYRLVKRGLGTDEAIERIAAALRVPRRSIGFGGLKDRHALTVQYVTIDAAGRGPAALREKLAAPGIALELIGSLPERLAASGIAGNRFLITVRDLTRRECRRMDEARRFLSLPSRGGRVLGFVNYFGEQRFGSARHGRGFAARRLIDGDFEGALRLVVATPDRKTERLRKTAARKIAASWGDWNALRNELPDGPERRVVEALANSSGDCRAGFLALPAFVRRIVAEAYQSFLWNAAVRRLVRDLCPPPFVAAPHRWGELVFPETGRVSEETRSLVVPLLSPGTALEAPWAGAARGALEDEGISLADLRVPGLRSPRFDEIPRRLFAEAAAFSVGPPEPDETAPAGQRLKRSLRFTLPRGAYATTLLAALGARDQNDLT